MGIGRWTWRDGGRLAVVPLAVAVAGSLATIAAATAQPADPAAAAQDGAQGLVLQAPAAPVAPPPPSQFDIDEFRIDGAETLPQIDIEEAIYPFLGPNRKAEDVEGARAALEKSYHDRGFQTVNVAVDPDTATNRVVVLKVTEGKVGRLRVTNAKHYDIERIKQRAPSLKEGGVPNFKDVTRDLVALNQQPDRRVTPTLRAGAAPGTVDIDLNVEDKLPLHGNVELTNRRSPNTTSTRLGASIHYDNLWQLGHSLALNTQVAPENPDDGLVFSGSYLARLTDWTSFMVYGVKSESDISTIAGVNVIGPGRILGARFVVTLPNRENFFHTLSFGADYKHFGQTMQLGTDAFDTPITYVPLGATYGVVWQTPGLNVQGTLGLTTNVRTLGSDWAEWDAKRYNASGNFTHLNAELTVTQDLFHDFQLFARAKGQISDGPLISSEQFSIGGADTVRGYLESVAIGDDGVVATLELRSPNLAALMDQSAFTGAGAAALVTDWRFFGFLDGGRATTQDPLADQQASFDMWSFGAGTRFRLLDHLNGALTLAVPMTRQSDSAPGDTRFLFSLAGEF